MKINSTALIRATIGVIWLVVAATVVSEISGPFMLFLKNLTGHHWVSKSILAVASFGVMYILFRKAEESQNILKSTYYVLGSVILGGMIIFSFFIWHFMRG